MDDDSLSDEDKALFREQMRAVVPLKKANKHQPGIIKQTPLAPQKYAKEQSTNPEYKPYLSDYISDPVESNTVLSYKTTSLSQQRFHALQNGRIAWKSRLDLHRLTSDEAREALTQFIRDQICKGINCVLIVHGKGGHHGEQPIIKNKVNRWLPQYPEVLAFHSAQLKDGGHGAVYVLLRKNKG